MDKQTLIENFEKALKGTDWYYGYSDDYRYYCEGKKTWDNMNRAYDALAEVDKELADRLYSASRPKDAAY